MIIGVIVVLVIGAAVFGLMSKFQSQTGNIRPTPISNINLNQPNSATQSGESVQSKKAMKQYPKFPGVLPLKDLQSKKAIIQTAKGKIEFEVYPEASKAASNFIFLAKDGFYDGLTFHRVVPGFVIQGGDPSGNGTGGPGYKFEDEPVTRKYTKGIVAMANAGPNTNGSQFFIMLEDNPTLPPNYTIFGNVILGQDVVERIAVGDVISKVTVENFR
ncbi:MAG: peptidylprolyl isomerase [Microgenomates group bacterium Gr01-1014_80]|nr:MAG: peptidylprolyl isomerase [Microgenomates group bacterium Gr01-1014_80]